VAARHTYRAGMIAWLLAALDRLPPRWRRVAVGALALMVLAAAVAALILETGLVERQRRPAPAPAAVVRPSPPTRPSLPRARPPVSGTELRRATEVAERFAISYLRFAYGRAPAWSVKGITPALRRQLIRDEPMTPATCRPPASDAATKARTAASTPWS